jgi:glutamine synthetase
MASTAGFIERHGLWTQDQKLQAAEIAERLAREDIHLVRLAWADPLRSDNGPEFIARNLRD